MSDVAALLASCAEHPPRRVYRKGSFGPNDGATEYAPSDPRVRALNRIWKAEAKRLLAEADRTGNYEAFEAHCKTTVQDMISKAVEDEARKEAA